MLWSYFPGLTIFEFMSQYYFFALVQTFPISLTSWKISLQKLRFGVKERPKITYQLSSMWCIFNNHLPASSNTICIFFIVGGFRLQFFPMSQNVLIVFQCCLKTATYIYIYIYIYIIYTYIIYIYMYIYNIT